MTEFETIQSKFTQNMDSLLSTRQVIYNAAFFNGNAALDKTMYFKDIIANTIYFLGYQFRRDNINGMFLYKVAFFYDEKRKIYPFCGDIQFARMFISGEILGDQACKYSSKMFYIYNFVIRNGILNDGQLKLQIGTQYYSGDTKSLCSHIFWNHLLDTKYSKFVETVMYMNDDRKYQLANKTLTTVQYTVPISTNYKNMLANYTTQQNNAEQLFVQIQQFQNQDGLNIQVCINRVNLDIVNSTTGTISIAQSCGQTAK